MVIEEFVGTLGLSGFGFELFDKFRRGFDGINSDALKAVGGLAGFALAVTGITAHVAETIDNLGDFGETIGVSVQDLQSLGAAALEVGVSQDKLNTALQKLAVNADNARDKGSASAKAFKALGVEAIDPTTKKVRDLHDLIPELADGFAKQTDTSKRAGLAMDLFGKQGVKLVGLLSQGSEGLAKFRDNAEALGIVVSEADVKGFGHLSDSLDGLRLLFGSLTTSLARGALLPLQRIVDAIHDFLVDNGPAIRKFLENVGQAAESSLALVVRVVLTAVDGLKQLFKILADINPALAALAGAGLLIAAAFASPLVSILLLTAAIAIIADDIEHFVNGQNSLIGLVVKAWDNWINKLSSPDLSDNVILRFLGKVLAVTMQLSRVMLDIATLNFSNIKADATKLLGLTAGVSGKDLDARIAQDAKPQNDQSSTDAANASLRRQGIRMTYEEAVALPSGPRSEITVPPVNVSIVANTTASPEEMETIARRAVKDGMEEHYESVQSAYGPGR